ncbi:hypothetical protein GGR57DRAFT_506854 [Xylariaceae sp. FL1272]|nr:hypothetical protein GGR57DRAFT_506854 [Xylariaceae sp. FL1272]
MALQNRGGWPTTTQHHSSGSPLLGPRSSGLSPHYRTLAALIFNGANRYNPNYQVVNRLSPLANISQWRTGEKPNGNGNMKHLLLLFKLEPDVSEAQLAELRAAGEAMVGAIPGLETFKMGPPLASTAHRAKGFGMAVYTVLDTEKDLLAYADHPAHLN